MSTVFDQTFDALTVDKANSRLTIRVWAEENAGALIWKAQCTKAETLLYGGGGRYQTLKFIGTETVEVPTSTKVQTEIFRYIWFNETLGIIVSGTSPTPPGPHYTLLRKEVASSKTVVVNEEKTVFVYQDIRTGTIVKSETPMSTDSGTGSGSYAYGNEPVSFQLKIDDQVSEIVQGIQKVNAHSQWNASAGWFAWEDGRGTGIAECRSASPWTDRRAFLTIYDSALGSRDILLFGDGADYSMSEDERLAHGHIFLRTRAGWKVIL